MKCKVCGYEFDSDRAFCPMCGSKVSEEARRKFEEEMSWNAYDFPKPKKPEEIEMRWPGMAAAADSSVSVMKNDASEGFVRSDAPARPQPQEAPKQETGLPRNYEAPPQPAPMSQPEASPPPQQPAYQQGVWQMPQMQDAPAWTPYNVQAPQQTMQMPPISPAYVPSSFTQAYGAQYNQAQYTQPQTAWTIPQNPQPGQQVFVTQAAQPVYIHPVPIPPQAVYAPTYPAYTQPPMQQTQPVPPVSQDAPPAQQTQPVPPVSQDVQPMQQTQPVPPVSQDAPPVQQTPIPEEKESAAPQVQPETVVEAAPEKKAEKQTVARERILAENIVASIQTPARETPVPQPEEAQVPEHQDDAAQPAQAQELAQANQAEQAQAAEKAPEPQEVQAEQKPQEPRSFHPFDDEDDEDKDPERFFTFNRKNEEFQQLLNREYERLSVLYGNEVSSGLSRTAVYDRGGFPSTPAQDFFNSDDLNPDLSEFEKMLLESTRDSGSDETLAINRERIQGAALSAEDLIEPMPYTPQKLSLPVEKTEPQPAPEPEPEPELSKEERARRDHRQKMEAMRLAREKYFESLRTRTAEMKAIQDAEFKAQLERESRMTMQQVEAAKTEPANPAAEEEKQPDAESTETEPADIEHTQPEPIPVELTEEERLEAERLEEERKEAERLQKEREEAERLEAEKAEQARLQAEREVAERDAAIEKAKEEMAAMLAARQEREDAIEQAKARVEAARRAMQEEAAASADAQEALEPLAPLDPLVSQTFSNVPMPQAEAAPQVETRGKAESLEELLDDVDEENRRNEKERSESSRLFLKLVLALALVLAAAEGGTVALRHYAPDSPASIVTTSIEQNIIQFVQSGTARFRSKFGKGEDPQPNDDTQQNSDVTYVLSELIAQHNRNIEDVVENLAIGYDPQRSYDIPGITESELVTDPAEKNAVCGTLIAYNSSWIDYVNGVNETCLDYLKTDDVAYRSAVTFDKIGQISEKFKKLEIGEIRKTQNSYFVFDAETIEVTQDEITTPSSGYVVYEMVPVGESLKIRQYYNITN